MTGSYQQAIKFFEEKAYQSAQDILLGLLKLQPDNTDIIYFLAVIKSKTGEYDVAIPLFEKITNIKNDHTEAFYNLALCYQNLEKNEEALKYYQKAVELNPLLSEAYNNIAIIYKNSGKYEEAEKAFKKAVKVKPGNVNAMSNLSSLSLDQNKSKEYRQAYDLFQKGDFKAAVKIMSELVEKNPDNISLLNSMGIIFFNLKDFEKAAEYYRKIISINVNHPEGHYGLAVCLQNTDNNDLALEHYKKAIELNPGYTDALNNLGLLYAGLKDYQEAEKYYRMALKQSPGYFNAIINLGSLRLYSDDFAGAMMLFDQALAKSKEDENNKPAMSVAYSNIGFVHFRKKEIEEAIKYFDMGIELNPDSVLAHYNKAEALLVSSRFEEGWKEYEWRTGRKDFGKRKFDKPFKPGTDLNGKRILVYAEQGLGDALQFVRYLPMLKERGCHIIFECGKEMHSLLNGFDAADEIIERNLLEAPDIEYDYEIPLLSLPQFFNTNLDNIPSKVPYLKADAGLKEKWADIINDQEKIKIGIVWAGSPIHTNDRHRSVRLQQFMPLISTEGTHFYSIQKGFPVIQAKDYQLLLTDLDENIKSFADTAAIIENLDLVITVDTSVAHLAGALGKETWVLIPYMPDWRWMLEGDKSLWYPTMKLYRQPAVGDWNSVFVRLKKDLLHFVNKREEMEKEYTGINIYDKSFQSLINKLIKDEVQQSNIFGYELDETVLQIIRRPENKQILNLGYPGRYLERFHSENIDEKNILTLPDKYYYESNGKNYDMIIANSVLAYSLSPYHTITEIKKELKPGGTLVITVPAVNLREEIIEKSNILSLNSRPLWKSLIKKAGFRLTYESGGDNTGYYIFVCQNKNKENEKLYLGLTSGENFGWGVCSKYLKKELSNKLNIINFDEHEELISAGKVDGPVFHALNNNDFSGLYPVRGTKNIGYTFFEYELSDAAVKNAVNYDLVLGGSSWNEKKLKERGVKNTGVLIQGIDPDLFYPEERENKKDLFVIFSGGKFELRKGQDLVLKAVKVLQQKYGDIVLINAWYNMWPNTMHSMGVSKHIKYEYKGETWKNFMVNLCRLNGLDGDKILTLPITPNDKLRDLYLNSDIGLFPNRCEGGTNLVLMEYMACGRPVIASFNSGHKDILTEENSLRLTDMHEFKLYDDNKKLIADWEEPDLDEIIFKLEFAYFNRDKIKQIGKNAGEFMKQYTWKNSTEALLKFIQ